MLVFSRKVNEKSIITIDGQQVVVTVVKIGPGSVRLGFEAPREWPIVRAELIEQDPVFAANEV